MSSIYFQSSLKSSMNKLLLQVPQSENKKISLHKKLPKFISRPGFLILNTIAKGKNSNKPIQISCRRIEQTCPSVKPSIRAAKSIQITPVLCRSKRAFPNSYQMNIQCFTNTLGTMKPIQKEKATSIYNYPAHYKRFFSPRQFNIKNFKNYSTAQNSLKKNKNSSNCFSQAKMSSQVIVTENTASCFQKKDATAPSFLKKRHTCKTQKGSQSLKIKTQQSQSNTPSFLKKRQYIKIKPNAFQQNNNKLKINAEIRQLGVNPQHANFNCHSQIEGNKSEIKNDHLTDAIREIKEGPFKRLQFMKHKVTVTQDDLSPLLSQIDKEWMEAFTNQISLNLI